MVSICPALLCASGLQELSVYLGKADVHILIEDGPDV